MTIRTAAITDDRNWLRVAFPYDPALVAGLKAIDPRRRFVARCRACRADQPRSRSSAAACRCGARDWERFWLLPADQHNLVRLCDLFGLDRRALPPALSAILADSQAPAARPQLSQAALDAARASPWRLTPYEHQVRALAELIDHDRWLLAHELGTGKTAPVACRLAMLRQARRLPGPVLVVCPKSVISVWPVELARHAGIDDARIYGGSTPARRRAALNGLGPGDVLIANYELVRADAREFSAVPWSAVIADECHRLAHGRRTQWARAVIALGRKARYRWALSGTPAPNGPLTIWGTLQFLDPATAGTESFVAFRARYAVMGGFEKRQIVGYRDLPDLERRVAGISSRVTKAEALDLPEKTHVDRLCDLAADQARVYRELRTQAVARLKSRQGDGTLSVTNVLVEALRLSQVAGGFAPDDDGRVHVLASAKLDLLADMLADLPRPLVVWTSFRAENQAVVELLESRKWRTAAFTGDTSGPDRALIVEDFQAGKLDALVAMPQAGGEGITLTAADTCVYYSRTYNAKDYWQSQDRLHRIGQRRPVTILHLIARGTIDEKIAGALARKADLQDLLLAGAGPDELL